MSDLNTRELKVGDKVGWGVFMRWYWDRVSSAGVSTVTKVTQTSITLKNGKRFSRLGNEIGGNSTLCTVSHARECMAKNRRRNALTEIVDMANRALKAESMTEEAGAAIIKAVQDAMKLPTPKVAE